MLVADLILQFVELLWCLVADKLFPALDVLRIGVKSGSVCEVFCKSAAFLPFLKQQLAAQGPNAMLSLRVIANLFSLSQGAKFIWNHQQELLEAVANCPNAGSTKNGLLAQSTATLNFCVEATKRKDFEKKSDCSRAVASILSAGGAQMDEEAAFRLLVAIGTLASGDEMCQAVFQSLDVVPVLTALKEKAQLNKVRECADLLLKL
jgi:phospholipase A-2-activating protein